MFAPTSQSAIRFTLVFSKHAPLINGRREKYYQRHVEPPQEPQKDANPGPKSGADELTLIPGKAKEETP